MSNSAFTPTTTQVTTEVPVNVPVVTQWQSYTPTWTGFGSKIIVTNFARYRRIGSNIEIMFGLTSNNVASGGTVTEISFSLPSGLTIDSTYAPAGDITSTGAVQTWGLYASGVYDNTTLATPTASLNGVRFLKLNANAVVTSSDLNVARGVQFEGVVSFPISQWSSGVTTLADRALEEYYATSGTWDANSSTTVTGPDGAAMGGALTLGRTKTITLLSNLLPTDKLFLEMRFGSSSASPWVDASNSGYQYTRQGAIEFGATITSISGNTVTIYFAPKALSSNTTYANVTGAQDWNSTWSWRLRKVSSGAQVGYPISTKNIVGATDGVAPVTGMLGEVVRSQGSTSLSAATGTVNVTSIQIGAGTWILSGFIGSTLGADSITSMIVSDASGTGNTLTGITNGHDVGLAAQSTTGKVGSTPMLAYYTSSPRTIFLNFFRLNSVTATVGFHLSATRIA